MSWACGHWSYQNHAAPDHSGQTHDWWGISKEIGCSHIYSMWTLQGIPEEVNKTIWEDHSWRRTDLCILTASPNATSWQINSSPFLQRTQRTPIATPNSMNQHSPQIPELNENSCRALTHLRPQDKKKCHSASFMTSRILVPCSTWLFKQTHTTGKLPSGPLPGFRWLFRSDAFNCAPVSLTCVPYKLFKHIFYPHIRAHLDAQLSKPRNSLNSRPTVSHYTHPPLPPGWLYKGDTYGAAWIWGGSLLIERGRNY